MFAWYLLSFYASRNGMITDWCGTRAISAELINFMFLHRGCGYQTSRCGTSMVYT